MKTKTTKNLLLAGLLVFFTLPAAAHSTVVTTAKQIRSRATLSQENLTATKLDYATKLSGRPQQITQGQATTATITLQTGKAVGTKLIMRVDGKNISLEGVKEKDVFGAYELYTLESNQVTIKGDIRVLECPRSKISSLDIKGAASLDSLSCFSNDLTSLNLQETPKLRYLNCAFNGTFSEINLTKLPLLEEAHMSSLHLTALDLSGNKALVRLNCAMNKLNTLDLSNNKELTYLWCYGNQIKNLDLRGLNKLKLVQCYENEMEQLSLPKSEVSGSSVQNLQVWCQKNKLASLDLSSIHHLAYLVCNNNPLKKLDISDCNAIQSVDCSSCAVEDFTINAENNKLIASIQISNNRMSHSAFNKLVNDMPKRNGHSSGVLAAKDCTKQEANEVLAADIDIAKSKNWKVLANRGSEEWEEYKGDETQHFRVLTEVQGKGEVEITGVKDAEDIPFGTTINIETTPTENWELKSIVANGEDITESKQVTVKNFVTLVVTFVEKSGTGIENAPRESKVSLYPNPASAEAMLCGAAPMSEVRLYGVDGTLLQTVTADEEGSVRLYLEGLPEGTYPIVFQNALGASSSVTLIIKR